MPLFNDESDVTLTVGDKEFKVNKYFLTLNSPVFRTNFTDKEGKDIQENEFEIEDVDPTAFGAFLDAMSDNRVHPGFQYFAGRKSKLSRFILYFQHQIHSWSSIWHIYLKWIGSNNSADNG